MTDLTPERLLALLIRVNEASQNPGEVHEPLAEEFAAVMVAPGTADVLRSLAAVAEKAAELQAEVESLRGGICALQDWALRERDEAWAAEKAATEAGDIPGPLDWTHRKGAALLHVVGRLSHILKEEKA